MAIQTATTGNLANAQNILLSKARFTEENNAVAFQLLEPFILPEGAKTVTVPKVGQANFSLLTDGVDMTDTQDIGMTTTDLTTAERGAKFILTDKLVRQANDNTFNMVGKQLGDGLARIKSTDAIALYTNLNGGTALGADNIDFEIINAAACIAFARANNFPGPVYIVHHPNAIYQLMASMAIAPETAGDPLAGSDPERGKLLKNFYKMKFDNVSVFQTADIAVESGVDSGIGVIASEMAMASLTSVGFQTKNDEDISLRATEVVVIADYGVFELDDGYGAGIQYEIGAPSTSN